MIVKAVATTFLLIYCFIVEFKWTIFMFGLVDGMMGVMIFIALAYRLHFQKAYGNE
jgi:hypothetical protein